MVALFLVLSVGLLWLELVEGLLGLLLGLVESVLPLVEVPGGELAVLECCFDVVQFLVHAGLRGRYSFGPMCQGAEDTLFCCDVVVAVPV